MELKPASVLRHHVDQHVDRTLGALQQLRLNSVQALDLGLNACQAFRNNPELSLRTLVQIRHQAFRNSRIQSWVEGNTKAVTEFSNLDVEGANLVAQIFLVVYIVGNSVQIHRRERTLTFLKLGGEPPQCVEPSLQQVQVAIDFSLHLSRLNVKQTATLLGVVRRF